MRTTLAAVAPWSLAIPLTGHAPSQLFLKALMTAAATVDGQIADIRGVWRFEPTSAAAIRQERP